MIDPYLLDIREKESSSELLVELFRPTLEREFVQQLVPGKNGISAIKLPSEYLLVGHASGGDYSIRNTQDYVHSVMARLLENTRKFHGAVPLAMANVIDAYSTDEAFVRNVGSILADSCLNAEGCLY